ncbi:restriction endonuclease [Acidithiobacillus thiooxidans]|uniref:Restriction endonuclease n=1 Tax=Acidithiobacillus thiooxidans TaxID=930 RepID=A0A1C2J6J8_ACITH|nr:restriction endonuclease [Acidithiobacillus thiooxidans]OCX83864.1 restriction endonuclease [Acidithiobacillus thiooxidans]OCX86861.1 restriction endonuclease [Acidithiobacillus thiooxidans]OFC48894.1 restriction endonuclease [Acidithiobacillus thiooxidans]
MGSFGAFCTGIRPSPALSAAYFGYYFQTPSYRKSVSELSAGSNINNLKTGDLASQRFPLPSAPEQTRIVEKLEELLSDLDAGVAELKAAQKKLAQYRQSLLKAAVEGALTAEWRQQHPPVETGAQLLQRILTERRARWEAKQLAKFKQQGKTPPKDWQKKYPEPVPPDTSGLPDLPQGWVWASVEQIASDEPYSLAIGPFGSNLKVPDYRESGVPLVFVRNIRSGKYGGTQTKYVTTEKAEELSAHRVDAGDVLITKMGEPPGDADVYPHGQPPAIITADCIKVRCWAGLMRPDLLKAAINSHIGRQQIEPMTQGVAQKKVSLGRFTSLAVPVPPIQEQDELIALVGTATREIAAQEAAIRMSIKQSTAQRQNILRAAFSGHLVPQDPADEPASVLLARIRAERAERDTLKTPRRSKAKEPA